MNEISKLEALLFVAGESGIDLDQLAYLLQASTPEIYQMITQLKNKYENDSESALCILEAGNRFILSTKKTVADLLRSYARSPMGNSLSQAALETLAIIAYQQPISRMEIDEIRGVHSSGSVQTLVTRQLIEEKGRVEGPGRAILYGTTNYFMDYFGLKDLSELPDIEQMEADLAEDVSLDLFFTEKEEDI